MSTIAFSAAITLALVLLVITMMQHAMQPVPVVLSAIPAPAADAPQLGGIT